MPIGFPNPKFGGYTNFGQGTPKVVVVQDSDTQLLAANPDRLYVELVNNDINPIWVQIGIASVVGRGTRLLPNGGKYIFEDNELTYNQINAIAKPGQSVSIDVIEGVM